jgi:hypothetical protein
MLTSTVYAQEYILGKSRSEVNEMTQEAKFSFIKAGESQGIEYDSYKVASGSVAIEMLCYYDSVGTCTMVRELIDIANLSSMVGELNYSDIPIK